MKEIAVVSGKGGTGKTSLVAALASLVPNKVLVDCDVDAADLHLVLRPEVFRETEFIGGNKARIVDDLCTGCGVCVDRCRYEAIALPTAPGMPPRIQPIFCEGCRVCVRACPVEAILFEPVVSGRWFVSATPYGKLVHAELGIARGNSGKLVSVLREESRRIAEQEHLDFILLDGPPGTGCPVIASVTGVDLVLAVTEPTLSGRHDLLRVRELTAHFGIPTMVCINKWDINPERTTAIEAEAAAHGIPSAGRIRYDRCVTEAQIRKTNVLDRTNREITGDITAVYRRVMKALNEPGP
jgi:MinD superfamily P-loop ATPase